VQKLGKGEERPILEHQARAKLLSALSVVDAVLLFDEETPLELLKLVKPDVLVKGGDYQEHEVVGRELVNSWGGRVELVSLCPGYSTSGMISRIRGQ